MPFLARVGVEPEKVVFADRLQCHGFHSHTSHMLVDRVNKIDEVIIIKSVTAIF